MPSASNTITGNTRIVGELMVGTEEAPPSFSGGSGAMSSTGRSNGSIWARKDADEAAETIVSGIVRKIRVGTAFHELRLGDIASGANTIKSYMPNNATIIGVKRRYETVPASDTCTASLTIGGNQVLASSSEDETGLSADTLTAHGLTGTAANLTVDQGDQIVLTVTAGGSITAGTDCIYEILYQER